MVFMGHVVKAKKLSIDRNAFDGFVFEPAKDWVPVSTQAMCHPLCF